MKFTLNLVFLALLLVASIVMPFGVSAQQSGSVSGVVLGANDNEPVIGANVVVPGTSVGTITDADGKFQLTVPAGKSTLQVTYLGYQTQTVSIGSQTYLTIKLSIANQSLDELVVVGYGTVKKRDLTGAVSSVKSDDIMQIPVANAIEAIQGKIPGMDITRKDGSAGSSVNILIRGTKTLGFTDQTGKITRTTEPLFIIDGMQGGSFTDLNPNDIESIDVLKDASSTSIYGSLGANGIVIITTKRGKEANKIGVSYNGYYGFNGWVDYPAPRIGESYMQLRREAYRSAGQWASKDDDYKIFSADEWGAIQNNQWVNWVDELTRTGNQQSHNLSFTSGNEKVRTYLSLGYFKEDGIFKNDDMQRYTLRANIDYNVNKWFSAGTNTQITYYDNNSVPSSMLTRALTYRPLGTPYNEDGSIDLFPIAGNTSQLSPLANYAQKNKAVNNTLSINLFSSGYIQVQPIQQVKFRSNISVSLLANRTGIFNGENSTDQFGNSWLNQASQTNNLNRYLNWDNILTYNQSFGEHNIEATAVSSWVTSKKENYSASGTNQALESFLYYSLQSLDRNSRGISSSYEQYQTLGFAGRINYSFKGKYLLTATGRWDGSSVLAKGNRWDFFPSISGAWRIGDEGFMESTKDLISNLKLRVSYGISGNASIPPYSTSGGTVSSNTAFAFNDTPALVYQYGIWVSNPWLGWEKSKTTNAGLDVGILKDRISLVLDFYNIDTDNILRARGLLPSAGAAGSSSQQFQTYQNIGSSNNKGIEIALNTVNMNTKNFKWNSTFTFAANKEKIVSLETNQDIIPGSNPELNSLLIGRPINSFYSYKLLGVWQLGEEAEMAKYKLNGTENAFKPGDLKIEDFNNDFNITSDDRQYLGAAVPKWIAGFNNTFQYKDFDLDVYLVARWGQMINAEFLGRYDPSGVNNSPAYLDYWTPENPATHFPRPLLGGQIFNYYGYMSLNYVDGSYVKLKNMSLGYSLPKSLMRHWGIEKIRLYATASNLWTFAKSDLIKHYDPERGGAETMPLTKQMIFGLTINF